MKSAKTSIGIDSPTRRGILQATAAAAVAIAAPALAADPAPAGKAEGADKGPATRGNVKQSLVQWCYSKYWNEEEMARVAKGLGCVSIELIDPKHWDTLKKAGLTCAIAGSHGFTQGMNNPKYQEKCLETLRSRIEECSSAGVPSVITFTGMREDIPDDVGMDNCVKAYKRIVGWAEAKRVTICLEMLNSRVNATMKGHPGYQGDHTDYCIELIKRVGSERLKLLFDIYHV
ncbi:MAG: Xylose isomerase domain protein barrel, partial [Phycisphaerales bacterium]|nr:Xylose isomerase domain protein barrel [Phycisphaerales bacterium]